jgi:hypothetical protein
MEKAVEAVKKALVKIVAARAAQLQDMGRRLAERCCATGNIKPTSLLSPELLSPETQSGDMFVTASEELQAPDGSVIKVLGLEAYRGGYRQPPKELCVLTLWDDGPNCTVLLRLYSKSWWEVWSGLEGQLSEVSIPVLVLCARVLTKMIESVQRRMVVLEDFERQCAERFADEVKGMLAEDAVGGFLL